ncbi:unnamed protein product, partial [Arabidopsis halleri]
KNQRFCALERKREREKEREEERRREEKRGSRTRFGRTEDRPSKSSPLVTKFSGIVDRLFQTRFGPVSIQKTIEGESFI